MAERSRTKSMKVRLKDLGIEVTEIKKELKDQNSRLAETNRQVQWLMQKFPKNSKDKEENSRYSEAKTQASKSTTQVHSVTIEGRFKAHSPILQNPKTTDEEVDACWALTHLSDGKFGKVEDEIDSEVCHLFEELLQVSRMPEKVGEPEKDSGDSGNLDEALKMIDEAERLMKIMEDETFNSS